MIYQIFHFQKQYFTWLFGLICTSFNLIKIQGDLSFMGKGIASEGQSSVYHFNKGEQKNHASHSYREI